ncbi:pyrimidine-nucleoside phosphorylase [Petrotoga miotherma DSM 10691]|uniref:Pyrimidine-nucleoside phosphorylase n=2 Tax=Petrotoga TaxID=28236 RepID=A0A2K1P6M9_9BACT|nr:MULTISPECIES: thymidine phosphorylase [Petrotoga]MDN5346027.1 pyrimidine-nucleoside phosphorylase [Petrotoga sp.]PNR98453.1 pyrimidine-nucleoside phosphorylase [Petrotoga miotherma DSM 10691]POZ92624.1 thymidine phosphorylase [Petrotoga halophila DSM 16923]
MRAYDIIKNKRDAKENTREEIEFMIKGYLENLIPDYQVSSWLMAIFFHHLSEEESYNLTDVMLKSGDIIDLSKITGKKIDKHSTGGVGDKTTIAIAPMVASLGVKIAKLSGRSLGHTGGTIDKLESIPGFKTSLTTQEFFEIANNVGIVVSGQTGNIAPADKKLYSLRDSTATVEELSLIASSIMSKKLAITSDGILLDIKVGSGAFMKNIEDAKELGRIMLKIAERYNKNTIALITNMDQPLGENVGNALEVMEAIDTIKGKGPKDFSELCLEISSHMASLSGIITYEEAKKKLIENIENGIVKEKMKEWIKAQGGKEEVVDDPSKYLNIAPKTLEFKAKEQGYITVIDTEKIGLASMVLGAGRQKKEDTIDKSVGLTINKKLGDKVEVGETIAKLFISEKSDVDASLKLLNEAYNISKERPKNINKNVIFDVLFSDEKS